MREKTNVAREEDIILPCKLKLNVAMNDKGVFAPKLECHSKGMKLFFSENSFLTMKGILKYI